MMRLLSLMQLLLLPFVLFGVHGTNGKELELRFNQLMMEGERMGEEIAYGVEDSFYYYQESDERRLTQTPPQVEEDEEARLLQTNNNVQQCPYAQDSAWYEMDVMLSSITPLDCSTNEWATIRAVLDGTLQTANLYQPNHGMPVTDLHNHFCPNNPVTRTRRALLDSVNGTILRYLDDDTDNDDDYNDLDDSQPQQQGHRKLGLRVFIFHLFFRAGGKCWFCKEDDDDAGNAGRRSRRRRQLQSQLLQHHHQQQQDERDDDHSPVAKALRGGRTLPHNAIKAESSNDTLVQVEDDTVLHQNFSDSSFFQEKEEEEEEDAPQRQRRRRRLKCGGCHRLNFERNRYKTQMVGGYNIDPYEYWELYGVRMKVYPKAGTGYAPRHMAKAYDTRLTPMNANYGDFDLGSPNQGCPGGGPGRGSGGAPLKPNGQPNPGVNCITQGTVAIIQRDDKFFARANPAGGKMVFEFRYPVHLRKIRLMDADEGIGDYITVWTRDTGVHKHLIKGYGDNSIETIGFNLKKVYRVEIFFPGSGAVAFIDFCHMCGEEERQREEEIDQYYPPPDVRDYENEESIAQLQAMIPELNAALTTILQVGLRPYSIQPNHCLYRKSPKVIVQLLPSTPVSANDCRNVN